MDGGKRMLEAIIKSEGRIVTIDEFLRKYGLISIKNGLELICPACDGKLYVYGATSINVQSSFNHRPNTSCTLMSDYNKGISAPSEFDLMNGRRIRALLEQKEFISKLYCFCLALCGKKNLPVDKFCELIKKADKRNLWRIKGLEEWVIGFLLLILDDFEGLRETKDNKQKVMKYTFRFFLKEHLSQHQKIVAPSKENKPQQQIKIEDLWKKGGYYLYKVFSSGTLMTYPAGNPYPVNIDSWERFLEQFETVMKDFGKDLANEVKNLKRSADNAKKTNQME
jgi:hypothetical protein